MTCQKKTKNKTHVALTTLKLEKCSFGGIKFNLFQWQTVHAAAAEEDTLLPKHLSKCLIAEAEQCKKPGRADICNSIAFLYIREITDVVI